MPFLLAAATSLRDVESSKTTGLVPQSASALVWSADNGSAHEPLMLAIEQVMSVPGELHILLTSSATMASEWSLLNWSAVSSRVPVVTYTVVSPGSIAGEVHTPAPVHPGLSRLVVPTI